MASLLDHAINIAGFGGTLTEDDMKKYLWEGCTVTKISWDGCMATTRNVVARGHVVRLALSPWDKKTQGVYVQYDGEPKATWESLARFFFVGIAKDAEVWI